MPTTASSSPVTGGRAGQNSSPSTWLPATRMVRRAAAVPASPVAAIADISRRLAEESGGGSAGAGRTRHGANGDGAAGVDEGVLLIPHPVASPTSPVS